MRNKREDSILHKKSYDFAIRIINLSKYLQNEKRDYTLCKQILRSGTAIAALTRESEFAQSNADFINKLSIALKEANETDFWLNLLKDTDYIDENLFKSIQPQCDELIAILVSSIKTVKSKKKIKSN